MTTNLPRRPLIDVNPDAPLEFYGFRIARDGTIYATTTPTVHGRTNPNYETVVGSVEKIGRTWVGRTLSGCPFEADRQGDAAKSVVAATERWAKS